MVRTCKIVSQRLTGVFSDKDRSCVADLCHYFKRVGCDDLKMLGCNRICRINGIFQGVCNKDMSVIIQRFLNDLSPGKLFDKCICLCGNLLCKLHTCCYQNSRSQFIMLCLGEKVCCHKPRIGCLICQDEDLTWSGNGINAYMTINGFFRQCNVDISRSDDLINFRNAFCSVCQGSDGLCSTDFIDFICSGFFCRN